MPADSGDWILDITATFLTDCSCLTLQVDGVDTAFEQWSVVSSMEVFMLKTKAVECACLVID